MALRENSSEGSTALAHPSHGWSFESNRFLVIFFALSGVILWGLCRWWNYDGLYGQDAYEYARFGNGVLDFFHKGKHPGDFFWPVLYPLLGAMVSWASSLKVATCLQLISIGAWAGTGFFLAKSLHLLRPKAKGSYLWVVLTFTLSTFVLRTSTPVMSDSLAGFWVCLTYYLWLKWKFGKSNWVWAILLVAACAVMTRYASFLLILFPVVHAVSKKRTLTSYHVYLGVVLGCLVLLPHFLLRWEESTSFLGHHSVSHWGITHAWELPRVSFQPSLGIRLPNLVLVLSPFFHPGFTLMGFVALFTLVQKKWDSQLGIPTLGLGTFLCFHAGFDPENLPMNMRFFVSAFPVVLLVVIPMSLDFVMEVKKKSLRITVVLGFLATTAFVLWKYFPVNVRQSYAEARLAKEFEDLPKRPVYSFGMDVALQYRCPEWTFETLWKKEAQEIQPHSYVLSHASWKTQNQLHSGPFEVIEKLHQKGRLTFSRDSGPRLEALLCHRVIYISFYLLLGSLRMNRTLRVYPLYRHMQKELASRKEIQLSIVTLQYPRSNVKYTWKGIPRVSQLLKNWEDWEASSVGKRP